MKKLSVQDVDRCVDEKQNSDSGEMRQTAPSHSQTAIHKDMTESAVPVDFDNVTFYAFRYCLGRQTYVVSDCVDILTRNWSRLTDATRTMIKKEIMQAFGRNRYGSEADRAAWANVLDLDDPDPITQDAGGLPPTTTPDPGQASFPESESFPSPLVSEAEDKNLGDEGQSIPLADRASSERQLTGLLPCPFCGARPGWRDIADVIAKMPEAKDHARFMVACGLCLIGQSGNTLDEAAEKWNTRSPITQDANASASDGTT